MGAARSLVTMNHAPTTLEPVPQDQLADVIGGGIGTQIGSLFGAQGAQWGGIADSILGMFGGAGGAGGAGGLGGLLGGFLGGGKGGGAPAGGAPSGGAPPQQPPQGVPAAA